MNVSKVNFTGNLANAKESAYGFSIDGNTFKKGQNAILTFDEKNESNQIKPIKILDYHNQVLVYKNLLNNKTEETLAPVPFAYELYNKNSINEKITKKQETINHLQYAKTTIVKQDIKDFLESEANDDIYEDIDPFFNHAGWRES